VTGLVTSLDPEPLAACLSALALDAKWARDLGAAGHERVRDIHWDAVVDRLLEAT
jgi:glycosyltransferase involved in cell wall biosynthesis